MHRPAEEEEAAAAAAAAAAAGGGEASRRHGGGDGSVSAKQPCLPLTAAAAPAAAAGARPELQRGAAERERGIVLRRRAGREDRAAAGAPVHVPAVLLLPAAVALPRQLGAADERGFPGVRLLQRSFQR